MDSCSNDDADLNKNPLTHKIYSEKSFTIHEKAFVMFYDYGDCNEAHNSWIPLVKKHVLYDSCVGKASQKRWWESFTSLKVVELSVLVGWILTGIACCA